MESKLELDLHMERMKTFSLAFDQRKLKSNRERGGGWKFNFFVPRRNLQLETQHEIQTSSCMNQSKVLLSLTMEADMG